MRSIAVEVAICRLSRLSLYIRYHLAYYCSSMLNFLAECNVCGTLESFHRVQHFRFFAHPQRILSVRPAVFFFFSSEMRTLCYSRRSK